MHECTKAFTFVLLLLLADFPQLLSEVIDDLLLLKLFSGQHCVKIGLGET